MKSESPALNRWLLKRTEGKHKLLLTFLLCLFVNIAYGQPAVTITNGPTTCGGTNGLIRVSNLLLNQPYIVYYKKNGVGLPGAFILSTDGSGNLDIVTWGTFTMTAGTYSDIQVSDGVVTSFFPGPYTLTDPAPPNPAPSSNGPLCEGQTLVLSSTLMGATYSWTGPNGFSSLSQSPSIPAVTAAASGTYTLQMIANATLCSATASTTVIVKPKPVIGAISNQTMCHGTSSTFINIPVDVAGTTFTWANTQASIGLAASGTGNIPAFTATNTSNAPVTGTVTITPTANGCTGANKTVDFTVNPLPTVTAITDKVLCNNDPSAAITVSSAVSGTTFAWANSKTSIGLAANGTGNVSSFTATNTGTSPVTAVIGITPTANSCTGPVAAFNITVNPTPQVGIIANQTFCNGATSSFLNIPGTVPGSTFAWTNTQSSIGLAASGTGNIPSFTATNNTSAPVTATVSVTPTANSCTGPVTNYDITVNPTPNVNTVSSQTLCNNATTTAITFSGAVSGTAFNWTNNKTSIGLGASGNGNIAGFTATNATNAAVSATIAVTPVANSCVGTATAFNITVNPTPMVGSIPTQTLCNGATAAGVNIPASVSGTTFAWTNNNLSIGLASSGTGNLPSFTATNTTTSTEVGNAIIVPTANGCTGPAGTAEYIVHPTPTVDPVLSRALCNGDVFSSTTLTGPVSGSTFAWTNNRTSIGLVSGASSATIPAFPAANNTTAPVVATISATATANGCAGTPMTFTITVNPTPMVNALTDIAVCNKAVAPAIGFTSPVTGTTYAWTNTDTSIGLPETGTGAIDTFTAINTTALPVIATITVTPTANNCVGIDSSYTITVNPTPMLSSLLNPPAVCNKTIFSYVPASATPGTTFAWTRAAVTGVANGVASGTNNPGETLDNTTPNPLTVKYVYTLQANSCSNAQTVSIVVNPTPKLTSPITASICAGSRFVYLPATLTAGTTYTWSRSSISGVTPPTRTGTGNIVDTLGNATKQPITVTYNYTLAANGCSNTEQVKLRLDYLPEVPVIDWKPSPNVCEGTMYQNFSVMTPPGTDRAYHWTADNAVVWAQGSNRQYAVVSFPNSGKAVVRVTTTVPSSTCRSQAIFEANVNTDKAPQPDITYFNRRFISLFSAQAYQWGYDDKVSLQPHFFEGETGQDYREPNPDFNNRYYWVITVKDGCQQKTYYNKPLDVAAPEAVEHILSLYPNPATDKLTIELKLNTSQRGQIALHDMAGRTIKTLDVTADRTTIDVAELPAGFYTISYFSNGIKMTTSRFAKN